jgi:hypothetical protein
MLLQQHFYPPRYSNEIAKLARDGLNERPFMLVHSRLRTNRLR